MDATDLPLGMMGVSLPRPWPWAYSHGRVMLLPRTKGIPKHLVGQVIAIHAGAAWEPTELEFMSRSSPVPVRPEDHPEGIVALVRVVDVVRKVSDPFIMRHRMLPWFVPPVCWSLTDVTGIEPVACAGPRKPGFTGLWKVPDQTVELLRHRVVRHQVDMRPNMFQMAEMQQRNARPR